MSRIKVVIPAYQPSLELITLVAAIRQRLKEIKVIVVNDGSDRDYKTIFDQLAKIKHVKVLHHASNYGKGAALKTAFLDVLHHSHEDCIGLVTADADGQHSINDIERTVEALHNNNNSLILGVRSLDRKKTPFRSWFGNTLTKLIFRLTSRQYVSDTQTGLRGIPINLVSQCMKIPSNGYEFELDMLLLATSHCIKVREIKIATIYIDNNSSSHFNPIWDSIKVYFVFIRFSGISILSAIIDIGMFSLFLHFGRLLLPAIICARVISGTFNFTMNRNFSFHSQVKIIPAACKYMLLAILIATLEILLIKGFLCIGINAYAGKIIAGVVLYIGNFIVQKIFIFKKYLPGTKK